MPDDSSRGRASAESRDAGLALWLPRLLWPLPGMLVGAAVGFHLYFRQPGLNTDTAAPFFLAVLWGIFGALLGALCTTCVGWLMELSLRRVIRGMPLVKSGAVCTSLAGVCLALHAPIETHLSTLLWPRAIQVPTPPLPAAISPCQEAPPTDPKARQAWDLECR